MKTNNKTEATTATKSPSHIAYTVRERDGQKPFWNRIGCAWQHSDGQGFNVVLDAVPIDGKVTLRVPSEKEE